MRLVVLALVTACGVQVDGDNGGKPDAARPDAALDAPADSNSFQAACLAKGYAPSGTLTSLYRAATASKPWLAAEAECAADVPGATHLVVLSSADEVTFSKTALGWVGLSDRATENTFVNVTLEPNDLRPFASGQPDNGSGDENCVQMKAVGLDDDQCDNAHAFVCECDGRAPSP